MGYVRSGLVMVALVTTAWSIAGGTTHALRVLGLDISAWQGNISQTTWNNIHNVEDRDFVFIRSSRGGTTGYYNQSNPDNNPPTNTLSQRYDDPYFVQNINRSTTAGMFAGPYHFSRPDIIGTTLNSNGIANSGADEADHFIQMAGPWMRPGYLLPVHDFEAGEGIRSDNALTQFAIDFSNRIYDLMGIRPAIYTGGNYTANVFAQASRSLRDQLVEAYPTLWDARWPNQSNPDAIDVQNGHPKDSYAGFYGPWDDNGVTHPWSFWQYASTGRLQSFNNGNSNLDFDVAQGGVEFVKDRLVPALWMNDNSGDWSTLSNWNSGQSPTAPVTGPGQVPPVGVQTLPTPRLPGAAGSGVTAGQNDTVILDRPNADITVTLSSGTHNIRKLYAREALDITGGSLVVNYEPSVDSTPFSAQFSAPVSLSGGSFSAHTLQVDAGQTFTVSGGSLSLNTIDLAGMLSIANPGITDISNVRLSGGSTLNLAYSGTPDTVHGLFIDGVPQATGTWGANGSGAEHTSPLFTGTGLLNVEEFVPLPVSVIDDFELDEGHFGWPYNLSPISQTFGLTSATTIEQVTTEHQGEGAGAQLLSLVSDGSENWQLRHNSGIGQVASPTGNEPLEGTGYVGFWLKTEDPGITVRIGIDDPVSGNTALERGTPLDVIADDEWHLYEWNFEDDADWDAFAGGANGLIDAILGTVTIDSIWFAGADSAQIYLDTVSHNPAGSLAPIVIPGDYNGDGTVDSGDYTTWRAAYGTSVSPGSGADGTGDGVVDTADYVFWRQQLSGLAASSLKAKAVPEPATILIFGFIGCALRALYGNRSR